MKGAPKDSLHRSLGELHIKRGEHCDTLLFMDPPLFTSLLLDQIGQEINPYTLLLPG
jgi:hypothetical protein